MTASRILFFTLLAAVAGSYTWGMRGTILGGEKGAMLPGAALGMILAFAAGHPVVTESYFIPAAAGAAAMFFGGAQTYGHTIGMSYDRVNKKRRHKGRIGLAIKGATWFGIFGGVIAVCFGAMAGRYRIADICVFAALLPVSKWLGFFALNWPHKPKEGKFPKFYFSEGRMEIWGGMLFINLMIMIFAAVKGEVFPVIMTIAGLLSGGAGFFVGNLFQTATPKEGVNGKFLLGKFQKNGFVESWKFMEFTLGALGGLGTTLCFCLFYNGFVTKYIDDMKLIGSVWSPLSKGTENILLYSWLALFIVYVICFILPGFKNPVLNKIVNNNEDTLSWPVYSYIPLLLVLSGCLQTAKVVTVFGILWVLAEEIIFTPDKSGKYKNYKVLCLILGGVSAVVLVLQLIFDGTVHPMLVWLLYCLSYEAVEVYEVFEPSRMKKLAAEKGGLVKALISKKGTLTIRAYSGACIIVMAVMGAYIFN